MGNEFVFILFYFSVVLPAFSFSKGERKRGPIKGTFQFFLLFLKLLEQVSQRAYKKRTLEESVKFEAALFLVAQNNSLHSWVLEKSGNLGSSSWASKCFPIILTYVIFKHHTESQNIKVSCITSGEHCQGRRPYRKKKTRTHYYNQNLLGALFGMKRC